MLKFESSLFETISNWIIYMNCNVNHDYFSRKPPQWFPQIYQLCVCRSDFSSTSIHKNTFNSLSQFSSLNRIHIYLCIYTIENVYIIGPDSHTNYHSYTRKILRGSRRQENLHYYTAFNNERKSIPKWYNSEGALYCLFQLDHDFTLWMMLAVVSFWNTCFINCGRTTHKELKTSFNNICLKKRSIQIFDVCRAVSGNMRYQSYHWCNSNNVGIIRSFFVNSRKL